MQCYISNQYASFKQKNLSKIHNLKIESKSNTRTRGVDQPQRTTRQRVKIWVDIKSEGKGPEEPIYQADK